MDRPMRRRRGSGANRGRPPRPPGRRPGSRTRRAAARKFLSAGPYVYPGSPGPTVHVSICPRDGPPRRDFARPDPPPVPPGPRRTLDRRAGGRLGAHGRGPAAPSPHRPGRPRARAAGRPLLETPPERRWWLEPFRRRPLGPVGDHQDLLRPQDGGGERGGPHAGGGPRANPRDGRADARQRVLQDPARALRRVRLERRADDAGGDHAATAAVLPVQHLRGLVLVALRDRAAADHHGPQADQVAAAAEVARRAVAGAARAGQPALPAGAGAVLVARPVLEELLHRRGRRAEDLGALLAAAAAQAGDR